jgi:hypothetical protein
MEESVSKETLQLLENFLGMSTVEFLENHRL